MRPEDERMCPVCGKKYDRKDRKMTYVKITTEHGFDTIRVVRTCSWSCKAEYEERVRESFQESNKLRILGDDDIRKMDEGGGIRPRSEK